MAVELYTARPRNPRHARAFARLHEIRSIAGRNLVRGILAQHTSKHLPLGAVNSLRSELKPDDMAAAISLLLGKGAPYSFQNKSELYIDLASRHGLSNAQPMVEVGFLLGRLNGWEENCIAAIEHMTRMRDIATNPSAEGLRAIRAFFDVWGVSNYLNTKLAYVMDTSSQPDALIAEYQELTSLLGVPDAPTAYFSTAEAIGERFPYFESARHWVNALSKYVDEDFRQEISLHNVLPLPVSFRDLGPFIRKAHSMSFVDEIMAIKVILDLRQFWPAAGDFIDRILSPEIGRKLLALGSRKPPFERLTEGGDPRARDLTLYRRSLAFLEYSELAIFRHKIDRLLAHRLLPRYFRPPDAYEKLSWRESRGQLTTPLAGFVDPNTAEDGTHVGLFLRSVQFLEFVRRHKGNLDFDEGEIRCIFENTMSLDVLMTDEELNNLYLSAGKQARHIVATLALTLYKERSHNDDIEFTFRHHLQQTVLEHFDGSVVKFVEWLSPTTPSVAKFVTQSLDRITLQKLYLLVNSAEEADQIRQDILRHMGEKLGALAYFVEADKIKAQRSISKIRKYIDDSRIYVDGNALKKWFSENPNSYLQEYLRIIDHSLESMGPQAVIVTAEGVKRAPKLLALIASFDYLLMKALSGTFEQFCINHHFGIESYLGRRIRHNTLSGMMLAGVDSIIKNDEFLGLQIDGDFQERYKAWLDEYKRMIEHIRVDLLQFKSDKKKRGIFVSSLDDTGTAAKAHFQELKNTVLTAREGEIFEDAVFKFCWAQISPQLAAAQKLFMVDMLSQATQLIERFFGQPDDTLQRTFISQLRETMHGRFMKLGSWFRVPEDNLTAATAEETANLIASECEIEFNAQSRKFTVGGDAKLLELQGSSVHRLYDCLHVLVHNAFKYGDPKTPIAVTIDQDANPLGALRQILVTVASRLRDSRKVYDLARLAEIVSNTDDPGAAMVREGYSGIRKVIYLTTKSEGKNTVEFRETGDNALELSFSLLVEAK